MMTDESHSCNEGGLRSDHPDISHTPIMLNLCASGQVSEYMSLPIKPTFTLLVIQTFLIQSGLVCIYYWAVCRQGAGGS